MAVEIVLVVAFLSLLGGCVAVLVWDINRRRIVQEVREQIIADLQLRVAELEEENRRLREEIGFLEKVGKKEHLSRH